MKMFKRIMRAAVALTFASCTLIPMNVSATYDPCDVNHDGIVSTADQLIVDRFLKGMRYYTEYDRLDVNGTHIIDDADEECIRQKILGNSYSVRFIRRYGNGYEQVVNAPAISSLIERDASNTQSSSRWYVGYSYTNHQAISRYKLSPTVFDFDNVENEMNGLIDDVDDRIISHGEENSGIVAVGNDVFGYNGTGFIVGNHQIATAAHCVHTNGSIRTDVKIKTYDSTGASTGDELEVMEIHVPEDYTTSCSELDYALITVREDLSDYVHFSVGNSYNMKASEVSSIPIHVTGQPDATNTNGLNEDDLLYTHNGQIFGSNNTSILHFQVDLTGGQSGAPVYTITRELYDDEFHYTYTALAIATTSGSLWNAGTLMSRYHTVFYRNNPYASYQ